MKKLFITLIFLSTFSFSNLKIGVSLLPYYSYVSNIVKDRAKVVQLLPTNADSHAYKVSANEVKKLNDIDVLVYSGAGIDNYMLEMLDATDNKKITLINSSENVSLMQISGQRLNSKNVNVHIFIGIQSSISQINTIAKKLAKLDPKNATFYLTNAREYTKSLSRLKAEKRAEIAKLTDGKNIIVATTHGAYDYLLSELGMDVGVVVEPNDNQKVSANDLKYAINKIKEKNIKLIFESEGIDSPYTKQIKDETGIIIIKLPHLTYGKYTSDAFYNQIKHSFDLIIKGIKEANKK